MENTQLHSWEKGIPGRRKPACRNRPPGSAVRPVILLLLGCGLAAGCAQTAPREFSGEAAYEDAKTFLQFGPRVSGTEANRLAGDWILDRLRQAGWETFTDEGEYRGTPVRNLGARKGSGPVVILGAHYDSRRCADQPEGGCDAPVLGANDGASGVAVLLELARALELDWTNRQVWIVCFDAEDNGHLDGWDWIVGSRQFARSLSGGLGRGTTFEAMILLDLVGALDQQFLPEKNSDPALQDEIWSAAEKLGYGEVFSRQSGWSITDDHVPFLKLGIPAVDIIQLPYDYWHTTQDTLDKISPESLERVGRTVETWLEESAAG